MGGIHYFRKRNRIAALALSRLVVSHWALDAIVHQPDLQLFPGSATVVGLNAWSSLPATLIIEGCLFGPPPPSTAAIAWAGHEQWLLVLWGYWIDRHRRVAGRG